jgi:hypothetical protein
MKKWMWQIIALFNFLTWKLHSNFGCPVFFDKVVDVYVKNYAFDIRSPQYLLFYLNNGLINT